MKQAPDTTDITSARVLELARVAATTMISPAVAESLTLQTTEDFVTKALVVKMQAIVLRQRIAEATAHATERVTFEVPAGTWQTFKSEHEDSWWLRWLVKRRPVVTRSVHKVVTLTARWDGWATFPNASIVLKDDYLGEPVYLLVTDSDVEVF